jgi:hypothetical protein
MAKIARHHVPHATSELETLDGILQYCQETLLVKIDGLDEEDLQRSRRGDFFSLRSLRALR